MINICLILILKFYTVSAIETSSYYFPLKTVRKLAKQFQFNDPVKQELASRIYFCCKTTIHTPDSARHKMQNTAQNASLHNRKSTFCLQ